MENLDANYLQNAQLHNMIVAIVHNKKEARSLRKDFMRFLLHLETIDENSIKNKKSFIVKMYASLQIFQKRFGKLSFYKMPKALLEIRIKSQRIAEDKLSDKLLFFKSVKSKLSEIFFEELDEVSKILGYNFLSKSNFIEVDQKIIKNIHLHLEKLLTNQLPMNKENILAIMKDVMTLEEESLIDMLKEYEHKVDEYASQYNKSIHPLLIEGDRTITVPHRYSSFIESLKEIFINCVKHGIEIKQRRKLKNKDELGSIICRYDKTPDALILSIEDDGIGVIEAKNIENNPKGLGRVFKALEKLSGQYKIETHEHQGFKIEFTIPHDDSISAISESIANEELQVLSTLSDAMYNFLKESDSFEVETLENKDKNISFNNYAVIGINGDIDMFALISIEDSLLEPLIASLVEFELEEEDKKEFLSAIPSEILNIVLGHALTPLHTFYEDINITQPLSLDETFLTTMMNINPYVSHEYKTQYGKIICSIINMNEQ